MKKHPFMVRLDDEHNLFIKKFAAINKISESEVVRQALQFFIVEHYKRFEATHESR